MQQMMVMDVVAKSLHPQQNATVSDIPNSSMQFGMSICFLSEPPGGSVPNKCNSMFSIFDYFSFRHWP
jgi:hypothetical protein